MSDAELRAAAKAAGSGAGAAPAVVLSGVSVAFAMPDGGRYLAVAPTDLTVAGGSVQENAAAGTVVAMVDGTPLVALYGDLPSYRDLSSSSSDGPDVYQMELNLVALGFDPDGEISIDENYDSATTAAVERWQESLGIDATGDVPQSLVAYIPGKVLIDDVTANVGGGLVSVQRANDFAESQASFAAASRLPWSTSKIALRGAGLNIPRL